MIDEVRDIATVLINGRIVGTLDRRHGERELQVDIPPGGTLDVLVEALGRINFGPKLDAEVKGIHRSVRIGEQELLDWQVYPLPFDALDTLKIAAPRAEGPAFHRGRIEIRTPADTFLDTRGWGRGLAWVNGQLLGRFWSVGPQQTLFVPASWLKAGANDVLVLSDRVPAGGARMQGLADPVFETPQAS